ncbi:hypothetical protein [Microbulbifer sp. GL-2]|uniref:hypothetical protein n=1 Tax=Microbulbifer sp. GL-2 TaxID=2591606 RepID=UPI00155A95B1|nr:hypothetical protein [Microbulbifer sp. GL-2]
MSRLKAMLEKLGTIPRVPWKNKDSNGNNQKRLMPDLSQTWQPLRHCHILTSTM